MRREEQIDWRDKDSMILQYSKDYNKGRVYIYIYIIISKKERGL